MSVKVVKGDITKMDVDVIVNAANPDLKMGGGVCGAIFRAAGPQPLQEACDALGYCQTGEAVITKGYNLPAKYIIHTPGPVWQGGNKGEAELLRNCYLNSLRLAREHECQSIAFPLISSGIYGYPIRDALEIAFGAIKEFLLENEMVVYLTVFEQEIFDLSQELV